jgi:hypothetical protein
MNSLDRTEVILSVVLDCSLITLASRLRWLLFSLLRVIVCLASDLRSCSFDGTCYGIFISIFSRLMSPAMSVLVMA